MPKTYKKKRGRPTGYKKKAYLRRRNRLIPQQLKMKTFRIKRDIEETLVLDSENVPPGWTLDGIRFYRNTGWALDNLQNDNEDLHKLFRQYRILGARTKWFFSNTESSTTTGKFVNSQILVRMAPNQKGYNEVCNLQYWTQIQAKKYKLALNGGRPLDIYMPLYQLNEVSGSAPNATTTVKPRFCPMDNKTIKHFGMNMSLERVDGSNFSTNSTTFQRVKIITTLYLEFRGIS